MTPAATATGRWPRRRWHRARSCWPWPRARRQPAGRVYLARAGAGGYSLDLYDAANLELLGATPLPGRPESLAVDPGRDRVYVTMNDGNQDLLWTLDGSGRKLAEQRLGDWLQKTILALDLAGGRLFMGRDVYGDYGVTVLDLANRPGSGRHPAGPGAQRPGLGPGERPTAGQPHLRAPGQRCRSRGSGG